MCKGVWSLRQRGLVYQGTPAMETTYPNIGKWIIPDVLEINIILFFYILFQL